MSKLRKNKEFKKRLKVLERWWASWRFLQPYGAKHSFCLSVGLMAAMGAVAMRLVLPWAIMGSIKPAVAAVQVGRDAHVQDFDLWMLPALRLSAVIVATFFVLGWTDFLERLYFARFVIRMVRNIRAEIMGRVLGEEFSSIRRGDMVARLVGDTARLKSGLNGFLVHIPANVILFLGVTAVLFWVNRELGLLLAAGGLLVFLITVMGGFAVYRRSVKNRNKEGELGNLITTRVVDEASEELLDRINRSSGKQEGVVTKLQGYTTWAVYTVFGLVVAFGLVLAMREVAAHRLEGTVAVVFALYAMQLRTPLVQLARQGASTGKIVACSDRLEELLHLPLPDKEATIKERSA